MEMCASGTETNKIVKGRKDYHCCECRKAIPKGTRHWCFSACWPSINGWSSFRTCLRCKTVRNLAEHKYVTNWEEGIAFGELYCTIRELRK